MSKGKGIYCLEGFWFGAKDKTSVYPLLDLLHLHEKIKYMYHRCATKEELYEMLRRWTNTSMQNEYPILFLASHGEKGRLDFGSNAKIQLNDLGELLKDKCNRKILYFGSCSTLGEDKRNVNKFLAKTGALAALGYRKPVDWLPSASLEILLFSYLQDVKIKLDTRGVLNLENNLKENRPLAKLMSELNFRIVLNESIYYPRKRITGIKIKLLKNL